MIDPSNIRKESINKNVPVVNLLLSKVENLSKITRQNYTIFAVCPNSINTIKASIRAAKRANAPIKFAATLNQIDYDGGYTGWTPNDFSRIVKEETTRIGYDGLVIIAIDHGGPWLKDIQSIQRWSLKKCTEGIKKSFEEALKAGYDLIHVDPTVDIFNDLLNIEDVVERTVDLISYIEHFRVQNNIHPIAYEVGTEEVKGGLADIDTFEKFLSMLKKKLSEKGLSNIWPIFVVGKVGTDLHTTNFDSCMAQKLVKILKNYGSFLKGHYTDFVDNPEKYPDSGVGAANVGPEFTVYEYDGLSELAGIEEELYKSENIACKSNFLKVLENAIIKSGRWKKWLRNSEKDLESLSPQRKEIILKTSSRYVWAAPEVRNAQNILYENLRKNGIDAENWVLMKIEKGMDKYFNKFNIVDLNELIDK
ncbi:MAG: class II D-tagatose-bisphosphate aldolase, non-catalytic subunit [Actinomycetota bacterium]|nr:class II D-tagatose-bisphosphate aldolase, non-catalytic subunit [Actinomycetota bacterium]